MEVKYKSPHGQIYNLKNCNVKLFYVWISKTFCKHLRFLKSLFAADPIKHFTAVIYKFS